MSLVRQILFDAMQAAVVARQYTAGTTLEEVAHAVLGAARDPRRPPSGNDLLLDGFATRIARGYADAVPLLRAAVAMMFTDEAAAHVDIPSTILGWFAADDVWDEKGRRAMFERAQAIERRQGALGAMRITLAGLSVSQAWAGQMNDAENSYGEAAEISALIGVPPPATTGVLLEVRAWQGRESESRAVASSTAEWGREKGASILEIFALMGLTVLELGLGRYPEALRWGLQIFDDDPPGFGNRVLPDVVEAGVRGGDRDAAQAALARLTERATAAATPWALGLLARSQALMAADADAETYYQEAIRQLAGTAVRTELARAHLLYGEWLRRRKRRRDAQHQLRTAYDMFTAMGAAAFADRAGAEQRASGQTTRMRRVRTTRSVSHRRKPRSRAKPAPARPTPKSPAGYSSPPPRWNTTSARSSGNWASRRAANSRPPSADAGGPSPAGLPRSGHDCPLGFSQDSPVDGSCVVLAGPATPRADGPGTTSPC